VIACQEKSEIGGNTMYRVLIVDDESAHRKGVIQLLNRIKPEYFLFEAKDGNMAELILGTADIDIILTDIRMPNKDGLEFLQDLHKANYNAKVIIITGHGQFDYAKFIDCKQHESDIKELINNVVKRLISRLPDGFKVGISLYSSTYIPILNRHMLKPVKHC
jgi:DNA-binding NtrC family response regulator